MNTPKILRRVMVSKLFPRDMPDQPGRTKWELAEAGVAIFHQFGVNYEELESGPGNFTTGVVEWPDGRLENIPVDHLRFLEPLEEATPADPLFTSLQLPAVPPFPSAKAVT